MISSYSEKGNEFSKAEKQSASADKDLNQEQSSLTSLNDQLKSKKHTIGGMSSVLKILFTLIIDTTPACRVEPEACRLRHSSSSFDRRGEVRLRKRGRLSVYRRDR